MKKISIAGVVIGLLSFALPLYAQVVTAPYWCGSYASLTPCTFGGYGEGHSDNQNPEYTYYTYPKEYYLNNYNFYFPYHSSQFYYES